MSMKWIALLGAATLAISAIAPGAAVTAVAASSGAHAMPSPGRANTPFTFQPIAIDRVDLPKQVKSAGWPVFTQDGKHLLFYSTGTNTSGGSTGVASQAELWIVGLHGKDPHCLSCGVTGAPSSKGEGEIGVFPDGKRIFFGSFFQPGSSSYGILECSPSVADCRHRTILPVDFKQAEPALVPPGGAGLLPQINLGGAYAAKLSPDGNSIAFSDIRTDSIETMVIGRLVRSAAAYGVIDPRVINPPGPRSSSDRSVERWSAGGALYELKSFIDGGRSVTYVQAGGPTGPNPDVWSVDLRTGVRTRLTSNPDYDEDNAVSPNGKVLAMWSNRTMHMTDWLGGLLPVRDFINAPAALQGLAISSSNKRCHGPMWILPANGDRHAAILGQPITYDRVPHVFVTNNLVGRAQWSPDGTRLALNTTDEASGTGYPQHAPFLLVAHFTSLKPSKPIAPASSTPGSWAPSPTSYHPSFDHIGTVKLAGPGGGSVTVSYSNLLGPLIGRWSQTYDHWSEDGRSFVSGKVSITNTIEYGSLSSHLTMTGAHTGSTDVTMSFGTTATGHGTATYDGHTVRGPQPGQLGSRACPSLRPKAPRLRAHAVRVGHHRWKIRVFVRQSGAGTNEAHTISTPVRHARIRIGGRKAFTNADGVAYVMARHPRRQRAHVSAGNTLIPKTIRLPRRAKR